jgi:hypothetical protein
MALNTCLLFGTNGTALCWLVGSISELIIQMVLILLATIHGDFMVESFTVRPSLLPRSKIIFVAA